MHIEIEAKVKVHCHEAVEQKLRQKNAVQLAEIDQKDFYFDDANKNLSSGGKGLRIRHQIASGVERVILTFKGKRKEGVYKIREEYEVEVSELEKMIGILMGLGYQESLIVEKKRVMWHLNDCEICLDNVEMLGKFVEVEGPSETVVEETIQMIGLDGLEHIQTGYASMIAEKLKENGLGREM